MFSNRENNMISNIALVKAVQQHPCLYNSNLQDYTNREVLNEAWESVARQVNDTVLNCRDKWRILRIVFIRKMKAPPPDPGCGKKNDYYLSKHMKFLIPYIGTHRCNTIHGGSSFVKQEAEETFADGDDELVKIEESRPLTDQQKIWSYDSDTRNIPTVLEKMISQSPTTERQQKDMVSPLSCGDRGQETVAANSPCCAGEFGDINYREQYLISLVPDVNEMNSTQFRQFRKEVGEIVEKIFRQKLRSDRPRD